MKFTVLAKCSTTKARVAVMELPHAEVDTPVFMPVGTQGTLKGLLPEQLEKMDCRIILGKYTQPCYATVLFPLKSVEFFALFVSFLEMCAFLEK